MKKVKMLWIPVVLGALLMATVAGVAGAKPNARPEASPALVNYVFSAHHCFPDTDTTDWDHYENQVRCDAASCGLLCPIKPPHEGLIRVQRLAMYAYDDSVAGHVCIWLVHLYPKTATWAYRLSNQCTSDSAAVPEVYAYNPANFKVSQLQDICVVVAFSGTPQAVALYGFKLKYEPL